MLTKVGIPMLAFILLSGFWFHTTPKPVQQINTYWFSKAQRQTLDEIAVIDKKAPVHYYVTVHGKKFEYSECTHGSNVQPYGRFTDYKEILVIAGQGCQTW